MYCVNIFDKNESIKSSEWQLEEFGFFQRGYIKEYMRFASKEIAKRIDKINSRTSVSYRIEELDKTYVVHCYVTQENKITCITDGEYKPRVAHKMLEEIYNRKDGCIEKILKKYKRCEDMDDIYNINKELDETKYIMMKSIESLLERGEKLNDLVNRSEELSFASKEYFAKSRELNGCWKYCTLV